MENPLYIIDLAKYLIENKINNFHITVVGNSDESDFDYFSLMKNEIEKNNLVSHITMVGKVNADEVFKLYSTSHIAFFTGDKSEGWSVGINEAMSCGCAVVSSNSAGAAPFLISNGNGLIFKYDSVKDLCKNVEFLINDHSALKQIAINGYNNVNNIWNHKNAVNNLSKLIDNYLKNKAIVPSEDGPCSIATELEYDWYWRNK